MNGILKQELGFQGFIMSDWQAQHGGVSDALAGLDMSMPGDTLFNTGVSFWGANLTIAVVNGSIPEWRVDDMATRIMAAYFYVGLNETKPKWNFDSWNTANTGKRHPMDPQSPIVTLNEHVDVRDNHAHLIRDMAARSTVLLKNEKSTLPLEKPKFLAVIGYDAVQNPKGPNGCNDRGCAEGTLAQVWGSGSVQYPYLVTPEAALMNQALKDGSRFESISDNRAWPQIRSLVSQDQATAIVFVNAGGGEGYINYSGNQGDRNNLTLWHEGDAMIKNVSSVCNNTIVVMHTVGPTLIGDWYSNPNITAILWAGLPGQESGNSITDVLYGRVNPAARSPFTWAKTRDDYGTDILYNQNNDNEAPQIQFTEGVFIDYRSFDARNITPIYEFGHGLSYTNFSYSNLVVKKLNVGPYHPTTGSTPPAPILGNTSKNYEDYQFPEGFTPVYQYIYPYLNSTDPRNASTDPEFGLPNDAYIPPGADDGGPQPRLPSSGAPGGNPQLWDVLYHISVDVENTGERDGEEVVQLYLSLGGEYDPKVVLRDFGRVSLRRGEKTKVGLKLHRRDLSNWDIVAQDWRDRGNSKTVWVGKSSRQLVLSQVLE